jgi:hypothetical protein
MIDKIETTANIKTFVEELLSEGVSFHPDDDFSDIVNIETDLPTYSDQQAEERNRLMAQCFLIAEQNEIDLYDLALELTLKDTGLSNFIPLPSESSLENK